MLDVFLDSLIDSAKVFAFAFVLYIIFSFFEEKIVHVLKKHKKSAPIVGSLVGVVPQCGTSVVAADLYISNHITIGTLFAVFFACSDEALPILFSSLDTLLYAFILLALKIVLGFSLGYLVDLFIKRNNEEEASEHEHIGCCHHHIEETDSKLFHHFIHPLLHSLKIFVYVFVVNFLFGTLIYLIGEDNILGFLSQNIYLTPLFSGIVGIIPNCASSVLITEMFMLGGIPFGAMFTGLCMNAGLGFVYLLKNKKNWKDVLILEGILFVSSVSLGYAIIGIMNLIG